MTITNATGWNGDLALAMQSNVRYALEELSELNAFIDTAAYREAPGAVHLAVNVALAKATKSLALHRGCIADFCAAWFDGSAFQESRDDGDVGE